MNAIINFINAIFSGGTISVSTVVVFVAAFLIYKIIGKHVDEIYVRIRRKKTHEKEISILRADLVSALQRNKELENMLVKFIELSNRQKDQIMHLRAHQRQHSNVELDDSADDEKH